MRNSFTSPRGLPYFANLKSERERSINSLINNLKLADVEKDEAFARTTARIKKAVVLPPVTLGAGKVVDHEYEERSLSMTDQMMGASRNHYHHEVVFPFTGAREIFEHTPDGGYSWSSSEHGLIMPYGQQLTVYVDLPELNPERAIAAATNLLSMTLQFMSSNNATVQPWNAAVEAKIDEQLQAKRKELIEKFGGK